jgi:hypothetical protein
MAASLGVSRTVDYVRGITKVWNVTDGEYVNFIAS